MSIEWQSAGPYCKIGVDWNASKSSEYMSVSPVVYRYDAQTTSNYSGAYNETLEYEPSGSKGYWAGLTFGSGSGERQIDSFATRKYQRKAADYTVALTIDTNSSFGTYYNGWKDLGAISFEFTVTVPAMAAPAAPASASASRVSDSQASVTWSGVSATDDAPVGGYYVEMSANGGAWNRVATATGTSATVAGLAADNKYRFRVAAYNTAKTGAYAYSGYIYTTPAAPTKVTASRTSETGVMLAIANASNTGTATEIQRCTDKADASTYVNLAATTALATSYTDDPGGGTFYYRARNSRGALASAWSPWSGAVVTICAPAAPTPKAPAEGVVVKTSDEYVTFEWLHNPLDGSAQTRANLRYSIDGGSTWTLRYVTSSDGSLSIKNPFSNGDAVLWGVRTKGVADDWSPWSASRSFRAYSQPRVWVESPSAVTGVPVDVRIGYSDEGGEMASLLAAFRVGGELKWRGSFEPGLSFSVPKSEFLPEDGTQIEISVYPTSTTGLSAHALAYADVALDKPGEASLSLYPDAESGAMGVLFAFPAGYDIADAELYRLTGGARVLVASGILDGQTVSDAYAPLNADYSYQGVLYLDSGAYSVASIDARLDTHYAFFMGDGVAARCRLNPESESSLSRPHAAAVRFAGREFPVAFDAETGTDWAVSYKGAIPSVDDRDAFQSLIRSGSRCVFKSHRGEVMRAMLSSVKLTPARSRAYYGEVAVSLARVDGDAM